MNAVFKPPSESGAAHVESPGYHVAVRPLSFFRASEVTDAQHVRKLADRMLGAATWTTPIPVTRDRGIVMDGNHRLCAAALLGLRYVPCVLLDYHDPRVLVTDWTTGEAFSIEAIYEAVLARRTLGYKTTRHQFSPALPSTDIPLHLLAG